MSGPTYYPRQPMDLRFDAGHRSWGDGLGDGMTPLREHKIEDISYSDSPCWVRCIDGSVLEAPTPERLERVWDVHRGLTTVGQRAVSRSGEQATDEEVSDFLRKLRA